MQPQQPGIARPGIATAAPGIAPRPAMAPQQTHPQQLRPAVAPGTPGQSLPRPGVAPAINPAAAPVKPQAAEPAIALDDEVVDLETDGTPAAAPVSKIKFGAEIHRHHDWKRQPTKGGMLGGACRVRTFHGKLSDQGLEYIDEAINVWLDGNPDIDIKFVTTNVGMFDGKFKDLALIVNVWY
jgi:hypothetical protein